MGKTAYCAVCAELPGEQAVPTRHGNKLMCQACAPPTWAARGPLGMRCPECGSTEGFRTGAGRRARPFDPTQPGRREQKTLQNPLTPCSCDFCGHTSALHDFLMATWWPGDPRLP